VPRAPLMILALLIFALLMAAAAGLVEVRSAPWWSVAGFSVGDPGVLPASADTGPSPGGTRDDAPHAGPASARHSVALSAPSPALQPSGPDKPSRSAEPAPPPRPAKVAAMPPITFFVAQGSADACGRDCAEWIAADGAIDAAAPQRLRALLNQIGRRKLPIYFHSPGGSVSGALAIGRLMRERGITAGVAWTVPQGCDPKQAREESCDKLKRSGRDLQAQLDTGRTMCNSACVYALAGAAVREIAPGASLGIHSSSFKFVDGNGRGSSRPPPIAIRAIVTASYQRLGRYLGEMGVDPALVAAARQIANDHVRFLTRAEIWRFNIDRRTFVESNWKVVEEPTRAINKVFVADAKGGGRADFRTVLIRLTCSAPDRLRVDVARQVASGDDARSASIKLSVGAATRILKPARRAVESGGKAEYDVSSADVPPSFLLEAGDTIAVADAPAAPAQASAQSSGPSVNLSTLGLAPALATLLPSCGVAATPVKMGAPGAIVP
jgi:hypothetical protein